MQKHLWKNMDLSNYSSNKKSATQNSEEEMPTGCLFFFAFPYSFIMKKTKIRTGSKFYTLSKKV